MDQVLGAYSEPKPADVEIQKICDEVKPQVEKKTGKIYKEFTGLVYRTQIVSGCNYLIMVHVGGNDYINIIVYQNTSGDKTVTCVQKTPDPLPVEPTSQQALLLNP